MNDLLLALLACLVALLLALAGAAAILPRSGEKWIHPSTSVLIVAAGLAGGASSLLGGGQPAWLLLPTTLPLQLRLDPFAAFCLLAFLPLCAAPVVSRQTGPGSGLLPAGFAGLVVTALAGDMPTCALGVGITAFAFRGHTRSSARVCLAGAVAPLVVAALGRSLTPEVPSALGIPVALGGIALSVTAAVLAASRETLDDSVLCAAGQQSGLALAAIGIAMLAQACDRPDAAALALVGAMLLALGQSLHGTAGVLAAGAIESAAATRRLDRLGGLVHRMPATTLTLSVALVFPAALPPFAGFAGLWLTFQAALAITRSGAPLVQVTLIAVTAGMGLAAALGIAALVRGVGVACLGRPRTPRSAVAADCRAHHGIWVALATVAALIGLFPGPVLRLVSVPAIQTATGIDLSGNAGWFLLTPGAGQPGYAPLAIGVMAAMSWSGLFWLLRHQPQPTPRPVSIWQDGFAAPPAWLPFGDPLTQAGTSGFAPNPPAIPRWRSLIPTRLQPPSPAAAAGLLIVLVAGGGLVLRWASLP